MNFWKMLIIGIFYLLWQFVPAGVELVEAGGFRGRYISPQEYHAGWRVNPRSGQLFNCRNNMLSYGCADYRLPELRYYNHGGHGHQNRTYGDEYYVYDLLGVLIGNAHELRCAIDPDSCRPQPRIVERVIERPIIIERERIVERPVQAEPFYGQIGNGPVQCADEQLRRNKVPMGTKGWLQDLRTGKRCYYDLS